MLGASRLQPEMCAADRAGERTSKTFIALSELLLSQRAPYFALF